MSWWVTPFTENEFLLRALLAGLLVALACAIVGTFVVLRGLAFIGDALAHGVLPGVAGALLLGAPGIVGAAVGAAPDDRRGQPRDEPLAPDRRHGDRPAVRRDARARRGDRVALGLVQPATSSASCSARCSGCLGEDLSGQRARPGRRSRPSARVFARPFLLLSFDPEQADVAGWPSRRYQLHPARDGRPGGDHVVPDRRDAAGVRDAPRPRRAPAPCWPAAGGDDGVGGRDRVAVGLPRSADQLPLRRRRVGEHRRRRRSVFFGVFAVQAVQQSIRERTVPGPHRTATGPATRARRPAVVRHTVRRVVRSLGRGDARMTGTEVTVRPGPGRRVPAPRGGSRDRHQAAGRGSHSPWWAPTARASRRFSRRSIGLLAARQAGRSRSSGPGRGRLPRRVAYLGQFRSTSGLLPLRAADVVLMGRYPRRGLLGPDHPRRP